jgi:hypothetical protein
MQKLLSGPQPDTLSGQLILKIIRYLGADSHRIIDTTHSRMRRAQRRISRIQIERCIRKGLLSTVDPPHINIHGQWTAVIQRQAAGEEVTCVVVIDWPERLIIVTAY